MGPTTTGDHASFLNVRLKARSRPPWHKEAASPRPRRPATCASAWGSRTQAAHDPWRSQHSALPNAALELGLSRALAARREWAGYFGVDANGNRAILLNNAGIRFVEATTDETLNSIVPVQPSPELLSLHPSGDADAEELMLVQVRRFACGSMAVGLTAHHLVADAYGRCGFVTAWGKATRGAAVDDLDPAVHRRSSVFTPRDPLRIEFQHRGVEFKRRGEEEEKGMENADPGDEVVVWRVHFSAKMVSGLKTAGAPRGQYSALKSLAAHLWRCVTVARRLDESKVTALKMAVNGRRRMRHPAVPEGRCGAPPSSSRAVARIDDSYFRSFIDFAGSGVVEEEGLVPAADPTMMVHSPDVGVYSALGIPVYDVDFGAGRPFLYMPGYLPDKGLLFILPSPSGDGSLDVEDRLFAAAMDIFDKCCYSLPTPPALKQPFSASGSH
ncbi:hypothetical protein BS78_06G033600 [Paspalum vaginatum]|nr:hypothetical protein BS78_06G033600 [Paspalum vaginatum]